MLSALPKALVAGLATISGVSNACRTSFAEVGLHGGGLETQANARWQSRWQPPIQACLGEPWVQRFDPDRSIVECTLREVANWQQHGEDPYSAEVLARGVAHHKIPSSPSVSELARPTPGALGRATGDADAIVRGMDTYELEMDRTEVDYWFHTSRSMSDLSKPTEPYTVDRLMALLEESLGVDSFKDEAGPLSFKLHEMIKSAGDLIDRLEPELMRSNADRLAFNKKVNKHFSPTPDAGITKRQFRTLLSELAKHLNRKYPVQTT